VIPVVCGGIGSIIIFLYPENPRFLVTQKKYEEARKVFNKMAKINGLGEGRADNLVFKEEIGL